MTREKLISLQEQDPSLTKFMKEAEQNKKVTSVMEFCTGIVETLKDVRFLK